MAAAVFILLEGDLEPSSSIDGKALSSALEELDAVAIDLGVAPLMSFFAPGEDDAELLEELGVDLDSDEESWFEPADGLATIDAYLSHTQDEAVVADLEEMREALDEARAAGVRWRLAIDY